MQAVESLVDGEGLPVGVDGKLDPAGLVPQDAQVAPGEGVVGLEDMPADVVDAWQEGQGAIDKIAKAFLL